MRRVISAVAAVSVAVALVAVLVSRAPGGPRSMKEFDAPRMADLELRMWQAYYAKERLSLFRLLVTMLHEQYRYSWAKATRAGFHLARAAATFGDLTSDYDIVLPDLEAGYRLAKSWVGADFDPRAVAQAELAWWVARRIPGRNSPEQVGDLIADEYALLYGTPRQVVASAALLRARAGWLRDRQATQPDWDTIGRLLRQSYGELFDALHKPLTAAPVPSAPL